MRGYVANTHHDWFDFLAQGAQWEALSWLTSVNVH